MFFSAFWKLLTGHSQAKENKKCHLFAKNMESIVSGYDAVAYLLYQRHSNLKPMQEYGERKQKEP